MTFANSCPKLYLVLNVVGAERCVGCCMPGRTGLNTGVYPTLLQRGGKDWMLGYTRKMITISTDGKTIQRQR